MTQPEWFVSNCRVGVACAGTPTELQTLLIRDPGPGDDVKHFAETTPLGLVAAVAVALSPVCGAASSERRHRSAPQRISGPEKPDLSARQRVGGASYYAQEFFGRPMADGAPMNPSSNNAASRTLPLGTVAKVTNVATGKSAIVNIEDRGPYIKGRIVDLSPATARQIGLTPHIGVTQVVVAPIAVPLPDGRIRRGPAAHQPSTRGSHLGRLRNRQPAGVPAKRAQSADPEKP